MKTATVENQVRKNASMRIFNFRIEGYEREFKIYNTITNELMELVKCKVSYARQANKDFHYIGSPLRYREVQFNSYSCTGEVDSYCDLSNPIF